MIYMLAIWIFVVVAVSVSMRTIREMRTELDKLNERVTELDKLNERVSDIEKELSRLGVAKMNAPERWGKNW